MAVQQKHQVNQTQRINAFFKQVQKVWFIEALYSTEDLLKKADARLFGQMQNVYLILPYNNTSLHLPLRKRGHIHSFIRGGGWPLAVFRHAFQPTANAEA